MTAMLLMLALPVAFTLTEADIDVTPLNSSSSVVIEGQQQSVPQDPRSADSADTGAPQSPQVCESRGQLRHCLGTSVQVLMPTDPNVAAEIRRAVESVGLPALTLRIQPGGETLVNVATIFHTEAPVFRHTTVLLGQAVEITATPVSFTWHHGDGTTQTTTTPGAAYPSTDVTHRYTRVADDLAPRVDVAYHVTYRVNGGPSLEIDQPITAPGPAATLDVAEAAPVVVAP